MFFLFHVCSQVRITESSRVCGIFNNSKFIHNHHLPPLNSLNLQYMKATILLTEMGKQNKIVEAMLKYKDNANVYISTPRKCYTQTLRKHQCFPYDFLVFPAIDVSVFQAVLLNGCIRWQFV